MRVTPVPCLSDNYAYLISADAGTEALVVDPSEDAPVLAALEAAGLSLVGILATHHHWDHVGGIEALRKRFGDIPVVGHVSERERIPALSVALEQGQEHSMAGLSFNVMHVPGHTLGALAYCFEGAVFTGDTLFAAGCGRLFEGTAEMMYESLNEKIAGLPDGTRIYFGHEYTAANLAFAAHIEPGNPDVQAKRSRVAELRKAGLPTTPSTLAEERRTNPFMRCDSPEIIRTLGERLQGDHGPAAVLGAVRAAKDAFR